MRIVNPTALLALSLSLAACSGGGGGGGGGVTNQLAGSMLLLPTDSTILEAEPNDSADNAHVLGSLDPGGSITVVGNITDDGSDPFDGFLVTASSRSTVTATLAASNQNADLNIIVVDPVSLFFVESFTSAAANESGSFTANGSFYVLVQSNSMTSDYTLTISAVAAPALIPEVENNDLPEDGQYLSNVSGGDTLSVSGNLAAGEDDYYLVAFPEAGTLNVSLAQNGQDFEIDLLDGTMSLGSPMFIESYDTDDDPEVGNESLNAMTLAVLRIYPFLTASGPYTLTITGSSPVLAGGNFTAPISRFARGSSDDETRLLPGLADGVRFTEPVHTIQPGNVLLAWDAPSAQRSGLDAALGLSGLRVDQATPDGWRKLQFDVPSGLTPREAQRYTIAMAATQHGRSEARYAEPDFLLQPMLVGGTQEPTDPFYNLQWHYPQINLPAAWGITTGDNSIITAVLDTGTTPHPDLVPREIQGIDMISDTSIAGDGNGIDNDPFDVGDSTGLQPSSYHGSHVAGTIGAETNNGGVAGVTWLGRMMHVRVLGIGGGLSSDIRNGILWSAGLPNSSGSVPATAADIINMSLGGGGFSQSTQDACTDAHNAGVVVIAAAGNENSSTPSFPAAYDNVISVAAVDLQANRAPYSNFHPTVDIAAPGGDVSADNNGDGFGDGVLSTKPDDSASPINFDSYAFYQGTSMAAPHVAGVAGLILAIDPNLSPAQVEAILKSTATDLGAAGPDNIYGSGLVNAFASVQQAAGGGSGAPVLALGSSNVLIDSVGGSRTVSVANLGGMTLAVDNPTVSTSSGGNWLSASRVVIQTPASTDTSSIRIDASGGGLPNGVYNGQVNVTSNGGTAAIGVSLAVGGGGSIQDSRVFVLAVNPDTFETLGQVVVQTGSGTGYSFDGLPPASYVIVAGTDDNDDGFICDEGEPLCGAYPSLEGVIPQTVIDGQNLTGLDFPLSEASFTAANAGGPGADRPVFRRLDFQSDDTQEGDSDEETDEAPAAAQGEKL